MPDEGHSSVISEVAGRLRHLASELATEPAEARVAHLDEEIERLLRGRSIAEQTELLKGLRHHFPRLGAAAEGSPAGANGVDDGPADAEQALAVLERAAEGMTETERRTIATRLARAGLGAGGGGRIGWSAEAEDRLRQALGLRPGDPLEADRLIELTGLLADALVKLDRAAWSAWQEVAPMSPIRQRGPLQHSLRKFALGDEETSRSQVSDDMEATRMLAALLIGSTGKSGQAMWDHLRPLQPGEIELAVGKANHRKLWQQFEQLAAEQLKVHVIEACMRSFLVKYVEEVLNSRRR